jgi:hypothetical protein
MTVRAAANIDQKQNQTAPTPRGSRSRATPRKHTSTQKPKPPLSKTPSTPKNNSPKKRSPGVSLITNADFSKICRTAEKTMTLLQKKLSDPIDIYLLLKMLCQTFESAGLNLDPETLRELKTITSKTFVLETEVSN